MTAPEKIIPSAQCSLAIWWLPKGIFHDNDSLCRIATVENASADARDYPKVPSMLQFSGIVPIHCFSFALVDPTLRLEFHRKRDNIVVISAMISWSDDFLAAHWALGDAFAGLGTLIFTGY